MPMQRRLCSRVCDRHTRSNSMCVWVQSYIAIEVKWRLRHRAGVAVCVCARFKINNNRLAGTDTHTFSPFRLVVVTACKFYFIFQINRLRFSANCESRACTQTHESEQQQQQRGLSSEPYLITSNWAILRIMINAFFFFFWFCWFFGFFAVECGLDNAPCNYIFNFVINTEIHCW